MPNTKLSIIIPIYNAEKYIEKCLNSILISNEDFEIILIDDGSTDSSLKIINSIKDKRIKVFSNTNHGVSYSRNYGIDKSSGKYIMFVDADDCLATGWDKCIFNEFLQEYDVYYFDKELQIIDKDELLKNITGYGGKKCIGAPFSKLILNKFLKENKIKFKEDLINGEDMLFNVEIVLKLKTFKFVNDSFYLYRFNVGSATSSYNDKIYYNDIKYNEYLNELLTDEKYKNIIDYSLINGLYTILHRISFSKNYITAKSNYKKINNNLYDNSNERLLGLYKRMIVYLYKKKFYCILFSIQIIYNFLRKIKIGKEYFKKI